MQTFEERRQAKLKQLEKNHSRPFLFLIGRWIHWIAISAARHCVTFQSCLACFVAAFFPLFFSRIVRARLLQFATPSRVRIYTHQPPLSPPPAISEWKSYNVMKSNNKIDFHFETSSSLDRSISWFIFFVGTLCFCIYFLFRLCTILSTLKDRLLK